MITFLFYLIISGVMVCFYGPIWLIVIWFIVLTIDLVHIPSGLKKGTAMKKAQETQARKVRQFDHLVNIAEREKEYSWLKDCVLAADQRVKSEEG